MNKNKPNYKLVYKVGNKEYIFKSQLRNECVNRLLQIMELTGEKIKYKLYELQFNYNWQDYMYKQIAGYADYNY